MEGTIFQKGHRGWQSSAPARQKAKEPRPVSWTRLKKSAMTYFPAEQYHRQRKFHFCVRDGNRCFLSLVVTDKTVEALSGRRG